RLARANPTATTIQAEWAICLVHDVNYPPAFATGREREEWYREQEHSVVILQGGVAADTDVPRYLDYLGLALLFRGHEFYDSGRTDEGLRFTEQACEVLERSNFSRSSFSFRQGHLHALNGRVQLAGHLAMAGRGREALEAIGRWAEMEEQTRGRRGDAFW